MSFFSKYIKKQILLIFLGSAILLSSFIISFLLPAPKPTFREMTDQLFFEDILTDTLSLLYTIAYPAHYSIKSYPLTLPEYNKKQFLQTYGKLENNLAALSGIDPSSLSYEESYCYQLLKNYFT